jgi:hypothetical protein
MATRVRLLAMKIDRRGYMVEPSYRTSHNLSFARLLCLGMFCYIIRCRVPLATVNLSLLHNSAKLDNLVEEVCAPRGKRNIAGVLDRAAGALRVGGQTSGCLDYLSRASLDVHGAR